MYMPCIYEQFVEENFRLEKNVCRELPYTWHIHEKVPPLTLQNVTTYIAKCPHLHGEPAPYTPRGISYTWRPQL
jgi:hypothetical protein